MIRVSPPELASELPAPQASSRVTRAPRRRRWRAVQPPKAPAPATATWGVEEWTVTRLEPYRILSRICPAARRGVPLRKMARKHRSQRKAARPAAEPAVLQRPAPPWLLGLWGLATALAVWSFGYQVVTGGDLWWHLAAGRWIGEHRALPATDPWSFSAAARPWANHEWLADLVFDGWTRLFGQPALAYWKWGVLLATFLLLFRVLWRLTRNAPASYLGTLLAAAMSSPFLDIRPHLYTLLGYALLLSLALGRAAPSWALPALFLVWANLHGGVFFGWMALA